MKNIVLLLCCITALQSIKAQENLLKFDKKYYECENRWVALPKKVTDSTYMVCVIYLDQEAGFTLSYEGDLSIDKNNKFLYRDSQRESRIIYRIPERYTEMAIIPEAKLQEMKLSAEPDWLPIYRKGENEVENQVKRGFHFNHIGGSL